MMQRMKWNVEFSTWVSQKRDLSCSLICHHWIEICPTNLPPFSLHTCLYSYNVYKYTEINI